MTHKAISHTFDKVTKAVKWKKASIFIRWNWINCMSVGKTNEQTLIQTSELYKRTNSRLSARSKIYKTFRKLMSPRHEEFLSMPPKTYSIKNKK